MIRVPLEGFPAPWVPPPEDHSHLHGQDLHRGATTGDTEKTLTTTIQYGSKPNPLAHPQPHAVIFVTWQLASAGRALKFATLLRATNPSFCLGVSCANWESHEPNLSLSCTCFALSKAIFLHVRRLVPRRPVWGRDQVSSGTRTRSAERDNNEGATSTIVTWLA